MWGALVRLLTASTLDRVLDTIERKIDSETDRQKLRADVVRTHLTTRARFMRAGGYVLMLLFAVPLAVWFTAVVLYSIFWCAGCAYPQEWTIAALPPPLDEWAGAIILSIFGVVGLTQFSK